MAEPSLLMHGATASQLLPPLAVLASRGGRAKAHVWVAGGCLASLLGDLAQLRLASQGANNLWVSYLSTPLVGVCFLVALSEFQPSLVGRLALRLSAPGYVFAWYALTAFFEDTTTFSRYAYPLHALLLLGASAFTLVARGLQPSPRGTLRSGWFWVATGLGLHSATTAAMEPLLVFFMPDRVDLVIAAYQVRAGSYVLSFLAIAWGVYCPKRTTVSGLSSSPQPSA